MLSDRIGSEHFISHRVVHFFDLDFFDFSFSQGVHLWELPDACVGLDIKPLSHRQVVDIVLWVIHDAEK